MGAWHWQLVRFGTLFALAGCIVACGGKQAATTEPKPEDLDAQDSIRMAQSMLNGGRPHDALEIMTQAIDREPENAVLYSYLGQFAFMAGRFPEAEKALHRALELDPFMTDVHNYLGSVYSEMGRNADAEMEYRKALSDRTYPTPQIVYLNLGLLYRSEGRDDEALDALRTAVEIDPKYYRAHYELAKLLEHIGRLEEAVREYEVAEPDLRELGEYHYRLGFVLFTLGKKERARASLMRAISVAPGSHSAAEAEDLLKMFD
jgi:tetratricopeptide (TPR) repeat protein